MKRFHFAIKNNVNPNPSDLIQHGLSKKVHRYPMIVKSIT